MSENNAISLTTSVLLLIGMLSFILSCGDLSDEETTDSIRFAEFFFFPTAPYIDKSYLEEVPADEVASSEIDYESEKAAIQQVYSEFYQAFNDRDMNAFKKLVYTGFDIEFGVHILGNDDITEEPYIASNWISIKGMLEGLWSEVPIGGGVPFNQFWGPNPTLSEFYIRPKHVNASWDEASAKGFNCWGGDVDKPGETYIYFVKIKGEWLIYQLVSLAAEIAPRYNGKPPIDKYFDDTKYKAP